MLETLILPAGPAEGVVELLKPDVHVLETDDTYGKVAVEPLKRGFGLTIGNPLRRILLSSTNGSAVTWVKIEDVVHEYTAIPGLKEEVMELLLNIKRIRIRSQSDRAGKMRLEVTGEGLVCAGDISTSSDFEIVNPELHLATLDTPTSRLFIEFNVEQGVGYKQAVQNDQSESTPVGVLPVDAIFSPVTKVNFNVEMTRVGQVTDYERLVLEVWTDGTIKPVDAVREAAENLVDHFFLFSNLSKVIESGVERSPLALSPEIFQTPIDRLELSPRTLNCLKRAHITKVGEVLEMSDEDLLKIRNFGDKSLTELREKLAERGVGGPAGSESSLEDGAPENDENDQDSPAIMAELSSAEGSISAQEIKDLLSAGDAPESTSDLPGDAVGWSTEDDSGEEDGGDEDDKE